MSRSYYAAALACAVGGSLFAGVLPAAAASAPASPYVVQVKFKDDTAVSVPSGDLKLASRIDQQRVDRALAGRVKDASPVFGASPATLDRQRQTLQNRGKDVPDLTSFVELTANTKQDLDALLTSLKQDPLVESTYLVPATPPPPPAVTPNLSPGQQGLWTGFGIGASAAVPGALGANVKVTDIEYGVLDQHEDLVRAAGQAGSVGRLTPNVDVSGFNWTARQKANSVDHGTATAGVIAAKRDGIGVDGIVPHTTFRFQAERVPTRAAAVNAAAATLGAGDVIVLEMQSGGPTVNGAATLVPAEFDPAVRAAVTTATAQGTIVVAAAGNGNADLDNPAFGGYFSAANDSGAIIVGAARTMWGADFFNVTPLRQRSDFSSFGSRVNVHAFGEGVKAPGYGTWFGTNDLVQEPNDYDNSFGGTSSATAITGGIVAALSSAYEQRTGKTLLPAEARDLLVRSGVAQDTSVNPGNIGPQVHLKQAIDLSVTMPDTTITNSVGQYSSNPRPTYTFTSTPSGAAFDCRILPLSGGTTPNFAPCSGAASHTPATPLADGQYRFEVRARTASGLIDYTPATRTFGVLSSTSSGTSGSVTLSSGVLKVSAFAGKTNALRVYPLGEDTVIIEDSQFLRSAAPGCANMSMNRVGCSTDEIGEIEVSAGDLNDTITSEVAIDARLLGDSGNDTIHPLGSGTEVIGGGPGTDTATYAALSVPIKATLTGGLDDGPIGAATPDYLGADLEIVIGGSGNDIMTGRSSASTLRGGPGNDTITGGTGNTAIGGGSGNDTLTGGAGADSIMGDSGIDIINGAGGNDLLFAVDGVGGDSVTCGAGNDDVNYDAGDALTDSAACEIKTIN